MSGMTEGQKRRQERYLERKKQKEEELRLKAEQLSQKYQGYRKAHIDEIIQPIKSRLLTPPVLNDTNKEEELSEKLDLLNNYLEKLQSHIKLCKLEISKLNRRVPSDVYEEIQTSEEHILSEEAKGNSTSELKSFMTDMVDQLYSAILRDHLEDFVDNVLSVQKENILLKISNLESEIREHKNTEIFKKIYERINEIKQSVNPDFDGEKILTKSNIKIHVPFSYDDGFEVPPSVLKLWVNPYWISRDFEREFHVCFDIVEEVSEVTGQFRQKMVVSGLEQDLMLLKKYWRSTRAFNSYDKFLVDSKGYGSIQSKIDAIKSDEKYSSENLYIFSSTFRSGEVHIWAENEAIIEEIRSKYLKGSASTIEGKDADFMTETIRVNYFISRALLSTFGDKTHDSILSEIENKFDIFATATSPPLPILEKPTNSGQVEILEDAIKNGGTISIKGKPENVTRAHSYLLKKINKIHIHKISKEDLINLLHSEVDNTDLIYEQVISTLFEYSPSVGIAEARRLGSISQFKREAPYSLVTVSEFEEAIVILSVLSNVEKGNENSLNFLNLFLEEIIPISLYSTSSIQIEEEQVRLFLDPQILKNIEKLSNLHSLSLRRNREVELGSIETANFIEVFGSESAKTIATNLVSQFLSSPAEVEVPEEIIRYLIENRSEWIVNTQKDSIVSIVFTKWDRMLRIYGTNENRSVALEKYDNLVNSVYDVLATLTIKSIELKPSEIGAVIGPKGSTINRIRTEFNLEELRIDDPEEYGGPSYAVLAGSTNSVDLAIAEIEDILSTHKPAILIQSGDLGVDYDPTCSSDFKKNQSWFKKTQTEETAPTTPEVVPTAEAFTGGFGSIGGTSKKSKRRGKK